MEAQTDRTSTSTKDDSVAFSYKTETPGPDLLDYRYMAIEMSRMSEPGKVWMSSRAGALVDEIPSAYKDIDQVMADQADLVEVLHTLRQVLNYKGT